MGPFAFLLGWQYKLAALAIAVVGAFGLGFYTKARFFEAGMVRELKVVRKKDVESVKHARKVDEALGKGIQFREKQKQETVKEIVRYVTVREKPRKCKPVLSASVTTDASRFYTGESMDEPEVEVVHSDDRIPVGAVRLFNRARTGVPDPSPLPSDGEGRAASNITFEAFAENDITVAQMYNDLAAKHNALVDYVEKLMKEQQGRLD